jgi:hypothetical protein
MNSVSGEVAQFSTRNKYIAILLLTNNFIMFTKFCLGSLSSLTPPLSLAVRPPPTGPGMHYCGGLSVRCEVWIKTQTGNRNSPLWAVVRDRR